MKYFICDLDDCLLKTDMLYEQWLKAIKKNPLVIFLSVLWLLKGKAYLKEQISVRTVVNAKLLPYRAEVLELINEWKTKNDGKVILASASNQAWVERVREHLGIFDSILASSQSINLKGKIKLLEIQRVTQGLPFIYAGDSSADLPIWEKAEHIIAVNASEGLTKKILQLKKESTFINDKPFLLKLLLKQLRPHQWAKNALIFLPALAAHTILEPLVLKDGFIAFLGFSAAASLVYILNDLLDLDSDRNHRTKKNRPFASGGLSLKWGLTLAPLLFSISLGTTFFLPLSFLWIIFFYLVLNLLYSFLLKQKEILDIILLSSMYTLRIFAGAAATGIGVSEWLFSFSTLFFFSLACVKRCTELNRSKNKVSIDGRGYRQNDYDIISNLGVGSGLLSILVVLLYLQSNVVQNLYKRPDLLWLLTPVLLYWVSLIWLRTSRDLISDDPVIYAIKDRSSWVCLILLALILVTAT